MADEMTGYQLSRDWFDYCFENPEKVTPTHTAMYFFIIEHCNRLGWKAKFGLPTEMTKEALGIKNYKTFAKVFHDLLDWGFIEMVQKSKNQYSANIIAIVKNTKANGKATTKALGKAMSKHTAKQVQRIVGIDKPNNYKPINQEQGNKAPAQILTKVEQCEEHYRKVWCDARDAQDKYTADGIHKLIDAMKDDDMQGVMTKSDHPTYKDLKELIEKYGIMQVIDTYRALENSPKHLNKYKNIRLTIKNWIKPKQ